MKLTVNGNKIVLPVNATISIERKSPFTNNNTGSFSYPFPVPTIPNQKVMGFPGRLQRVGDLTGQTFVLEDKGLQVMRGEVDYDDIDAEEIGVILKSGYTEFYKNIEGKILGEINYGSESWPASIEDYTDPATLPIYSKLLEWDTANTTSNGKYVLAPFLITPASGTGKVYVNYQWSNNSNVTKLKLVTSVSNNNLSYGCFCLQFYFSFVLRKIFEGQGYTIMQDDFIGSEFNKAVFFGRIMSVQINGFASGGHAIITPDMASLEYSELMPRIDVIAFINLVKDMFCLFYEIDELKKEVKIKFKKNIFSTENLDTELLRELVGWTHNEQKTNDGFVLKYIDQDDELATYTDYPDIITVVTSLPTANTEGKVVSLNSTAGKLRLYLTVKNSDDTFEWKPCCRLQQVLSGNGENKIELNAKVPMQTTYTIEGSATVYECISLMSITKNTGSPFTDVNTLIMTLYHGRKTFGSQSYPYASFDRYSLDGTIDVEMSLKPSYLYNKVYSEFIDWQTYRSRPFDKYFELTLKQLIALQWGKRYMIGNLIVIFDTMNYELPFRGTVQLKGFTG